MLRILTTSYNLGQYLDQCLHSLERQSVRSGWHCHLLDDGSTDHSVDIIQHYVAKDPQRFSWPGRLPRAYQCGNYDRILRNPAIAADDICILVDGDDYLPDPHVFERVLQAYEAPIWTTWGSYAITTPQHYSLECKHAQPVADVTRVRRLNWNTSHLHTFRAGLWRCIRPCDLQQPDGQYWPVAGDRAFVYPMLEMAGNDRAKFLSDINYVYRVHPKNDYSQWQQLNTQCERLIQNNPRYPVLPPDFQLT